MGFGRKKTEEKEDPTTAEILREIVDNQKELNGRLEKLEQQPKVTEPVKPEVTQEVEKPATKKEELRFTIYDQPIKTKRLIIDNTDKENPVVYDIESALAKILNDVSHLKKELA